MALMVFLPSVIIKVCNSKFVQLPGKPFRKSVQIYTFLLKILEKKPNQRNIN